MDKKHLLLLALLMLSASASFADNPASKETLDRVIGAGTLSPADWNSLCPPGQSVDSFNGCTPNINTNATQRAAAMKLFARTRIQSLVAIPITDNNGMVIFHITGSKNTSYTIHNSTSNHALCVGYPVDNFPNEPAYNNPDSNPLYQFTLTQISPGGTTSFVPRTHFYDYFPPNIVSDYIICVGGTTSFGDTTTASSSVAGLHLTSP